MLDWPSEWFDPGLSCAPVSSLVPSFAFLPHVNKLFVVEGGLIVVNLMLRGIGKPVRSSLISVFALLFLFPLLAAAQDTGYISGTVMDKSGAAVIGAEVTLTNAGNTIKRNTVTNDVGAFVIPGLPGDTYDLSVTAKGFQKFTASKFKLNVGDKARIDVTLTVGSVTEEIVVTGESIAQVETTSSELGSTITGKQVDQLILNGRNFTQLVTLSPGVVSQTGQDEGTVGVNGNVLYAINGGRTEYNNWELDGGDNMDNGSNATLNVYPNLEAIAEFKVLTSNYGAQYGKNGSGTVEVETKSGTSSFHGSAFYYGRNEVFNARDWAQGLDNEPKAPYKKHDWGYTFSGPVIIPKIYNPEKKKTFFFWSQEWRRESVPTSFNQNVPSDAERGGDFSDLCPAAGVPFLRSSSDPAVSTYPDCPSTGQNADLTYNTFPNNTVPVDPNAQYLVNLIPKSNGSASGYPAYFTTVSEPTTWREELIRVDHNITDNYRLTFRYIHDSWSTVNPTPLWGNGASYPNVQTNFTGPGTSFVARLNATITPTLLNEFVASYTADHIFLTAAPASGTDISLQGFQMGSLYDNGFGGLLPSFGIGSGTAYGGGFSTDTGYFPWKNANPTYTYRDNLTWVHGNHTMTMGAYFVAAQKNQQNSVYIQGILNFDTSTPLTTGNAFADLLQGNIASYQQARNFIYYYDRYKNFEPYFQDDWRITRKLTLNLGLRWSFFGRYQEKNDAEFGFSPSVWNAASAPTVDPDTGALRADASGNLIGNQYNGYIQCGVNTSTYPGVSGAVKGCMQNKYVNPGPRLGFAYDPFGDGKTAIRGGYGIFFEHMNGNEANAEVLQQGAAPNSPSSTQNNPAGYAQVGAGGGLEFPVNPYSIPNRSVWPYVQQWNLGVQRELPAGFVLSVAYVGSKGTHLAEQRDLNQLYLVSPGSNPYIANKLGGISDTDCNSIVTGTDPGDPSTYGLPLSATVTGTANGAPVNVTDPHTLANLFVACGNSANLVRANYPGLGTITSVQTDANSNYNALQISARRNVGALTFSLAYTYSHSFDDSSDRYDGAFVDSYNIKNQYASSNFDMRHNLGISAVYAFPFFKDPGVLHTAFGGWSASTIITIQTGTPFSVTNGTQYGDSAGLGNAVGTGSRPDQVGNASSVSQADKTASAAAGVFGPLYYNPGAFVLPTGLTYGTVGRNTLYLPGRTNFDFGLFKRFPIKEKAAFEFRWETFNLFNHTQYNGINSGMDCVGGALNSAGDASCISGSASGFLHLNSTHAARRMQFGLRFQF